MILEMHDWRDYDDGLKIVSDSETRGEWELFPYSSMQQSYSTWKKVSERTGIKIRQHNVWSGYGGNINFLETDFAYTYFVSGYNYSYNPPVFRKKFSAAAVKKICVSFLVGGVTDAARNLSNNGIFGKVLFRKRSDAVDTPSNYVYNSGIGVDFTDGVAIATHNAINYSVSSYSTNELVVKDMGPLRSGKYYHVEMMIDVTNPIGRIVVYVNGEKLCDETFNRDRIVNGYEFVDLDEITFMTRSSGLNTALTTSGSANRYSFNLANLVIYTDDAQTPFPMGRPFASDRLVPTAGPGFANVTAEPNVSDGTAQQVVPGSSVTWDLEDLPAGVVPLHAALKVRDRADIGFTPSIADAEIIRPDGSGVAGVTMTAGANAPERVYTAKAPDSEVTRTSLNNARIRVTARSEA